MFHVKADPDSVPVTFSLFSDVLSQLRRLIRNGLKPWGDKCSARQMLFEQQTDPGILKEEDKIGLIVNGGYVEDTVRTLNLTLGIN